MMCRSLLPAPSLPPTLALFPNCGLLEGGQEGGTKGGTRQHPGSTMTIYLPGVRKQCIGSNYPKTCPWLEELVKRVDVVTATYVSWLSGPIRIKQWPVNVNAEEPRGRRQQARLNQGAVVTLVDVKANICAHQPACPPCLLEQPLNSCKPDKFFMINFYLKDVS